MNGQLCASPFPLCYPSSPIKAHQPLLCTMEDYGIQLPFTVAQWHDDLGCFSALSSTLQHTGLYHWMDWCMAHFP